jgi:dTDP-4-dehydrorhamnose reductase
VTEAHLAGPREEQMRWLAEVWRDACVLRDEGIDVRAVTAWSLLGAFDWNRLVTEEAGFYEPGAFDVRAPSPRPTGVARIIRRITAGERLDGEPVLAAPGWWRRPDRLFHALAQGRGFELEPTEPASESAPSRPILVCGGRGTLGAAFARLCDVRALSCHVVSRPELDITDRAALERLLDRVEPWAIVNAAGYVRVDRAEAEPEACFAANARGAALLADACARHGLRFLTFSSDLVFDGDKADPYLEGDPVAPRSVYGRSKVEAERQVLARHPEALVIRTAAFFGPWDEASFLARALSALRAGRPFAAASDLVVSPTYVVDLVHTSLDLLVDGEQGLLHLANSGALTWAELARRAAQLAGVSAGSLVPRPVAELRWPAPRPLRSALASERVWAMPALDDALERWVDERAKLGADREAA